MIQLLKKDNILIGKNHLLFILCTIFISLPCILLGVEAAGIYVFSSILVFFIVIIGSLLSDREQESTNFLLTLPISRKTLVLSKYTSSFLVALENWAVTSIILFLFTYFLPKQITLSGFNLLLGLVWTIGLLIFTLSILLPVYYAFGNKAMRWVILVPLILASFSSQFFNSDFFQELLIQVTKFSAYSLITIFLVVSLLIYGVSFIVSLLVIKKKDF
ncbi:ABC-2 transporter permease [Tetragenococcus koreensis]|uniref:ABC-2 transporter permease n=1 Tax=Tetragenococcus koreensis TaxID=290335 RepID=A0AAN4ZSK8_9ENTE|nr:ABC-2 transporter permease [Tetragenococcus koreensis]MCF1618656.1 ABC-2 transporter permease [Tetragenococcus koreensis]GEQ50324.1 hypothetical protein TK11N_21760 [Tetragenococcus koreensis]GEQ52792.1 hypothetical protein TK12N_21360 [Tetragenococcus koreensis]GEQ55282.1 hypothetical protein TK2N_21260 [Tetragenococcus koreensis]GEQ57781.1 hypothetical protein TK4N_21240 [Tetragenococcus koreensis]